MEETDDAFDERPCRVISQAKTTFFTGSCAWKPQLQPTSNSKNETGYDAFWPLADLVAVAIDGRFQE